MCAILRILLKGGSTWKSYTPLTAHYITRQRSNLANVIVALKSLKLHENPPHRAIAAPVAGTGAVKSLVQELKRVNSINAK